MGLALVLNGCLFTDKSDAVVEILDGFGSYDTITDISTINFRFYIHNENILNGVVNDWRMFFLSDNLPFLVFEKNNYDWFLCEDRYCANVEIQENPYALLVKAIVKGDFYKGENPDQLKIEINILDENNNIYSITGTGEYEFTRN